MTILTSTVVSQNDHGYEAGRYVATQALAAFQKPPALLITFISDQYDQAEVVRGIRSLAGAIPLLGCSSAGVITTAGILQKGLGVLALRFEDRQPALALSKGVQNQPVPTTEQAVQQIKSTSAADQDSEQSTLLLLVDSPTDERLITEALQTVSARMGERCTIVGTVTGRDSSARSTGVFVNDEVAVDALALGLLPATVPTGIGLGSGTETDMLDAAQDAARQAVSNLGDHPVAAAIIVMSTDRPSETGNDSAPDIDAIRAIIGRAIPFVGLYSGASIAPHAGTATAHRQAISVCLIGAS
jgi:hypothetical protein